MAKKALTMTESKHAALARLQQKLDAGGDITPAQQLKLEVENTIKARRGARRERRKKRKAIKAANAAKAAKAVKCNDPETALKKARKREAKAAKRQARRSAASSQALHLFRLPQSVQTRIYEYAVSEDICIDISAAKAHGFARDPTKSEKPALAGTCKRLRGLVLSLFFKVNNFRLICGHTGPTDDYTRVCTMDAAFFSSYGKALRSLEIHMDWSLLPNHTTYKAVILATIKADGSVLVERNVAVAIEERPRMVWTHTCTCGLQALMHEIRSVASSQRILLDLAKMCVALPRTVGSLVKCEHCESPRPILSDGTPF